MGTTGIFFEESFERHGYPGEKYTVRVLDCIDGLELHVGLGHLAAQSPQLVFKLTGDKARDLAESLERAANRVYQEPEQPSDE